MGRADPLNHSETNQCNIYDLLQQMLGAASQVQIQSPVSLGYPGYNYNGYGYNGYNGLNGYNGYNGYTGYGGGGGGGCSPCDTNGYVNGYGYGK